jgi:hypothetical protein
VATGPWDPGTPGRGRFLASDADRERAVDVLKTAFVHGTLTKDELTLRTGRALTARTYAELAGVTAGLTVGSPRPRPAPAAKTAPARDGRVSSGQVSKGQVSKGQVSKRRVSKKVVAWSACGVVLPAGLGAAFLNYYGGFVVIMLFMFVGAVLCSKPPAPPRSPLAKSMGGKH